MPLTRVCAAPAALGQARKRAVGGQGGRGGDVIIEASAHVRSLAFSKFVFSGRNGTDAKGKGKSGRRGKDTKVVVPCGTTVHLVERIGSATPELSMDEEEMLRKELMRRALSSEPIDLEEEDDEYEEAESGGEYELSDSDAEHGAEHGEEERHDELTLVADLDNAGDTYVAAVGGAAGMGNRSLRRGEETPDTPHIQGQNGTSAFLELQLKSIADVGLVGFPNAGKSTFLGSICRAKPKVAPYPFTTLHPALGVVRFKDTDTLTVADIPGLIDGAHENRGLGHDFLRHIERTKVLLYVVDVSPHNERSPVEDLRALQYELAMYDEELLQRPAAVLANKVDVDGSDVGLATLREATHLPVISCSAKEGRDVGIAVDSLRWLRDAAGL